MTTADSLKAYSLELKIDKLNETAKSIDSYIDLIINKIDNNTKMYSLTKDEKYKIESDNLKKELTTTRIKRGRLDLIIKKKKIKLKVLKADDCLKDGEIALINDFDTIEGKYNIYKINNEQKVGFIAFSPKYYETDIGSIGYEVYEPYRGNHYAYRSLKLLSNYLSKNGIEKLSIVAEVDNASSIDVMEKFKNDVYKTENESDKYNSLKKYIYKIKKEK